MDATGIIVNVASGIAIVGLIVAICVQISENTKLNDKTTKESEKS